MSLVVVIIIEQRVLHYFKCISISTGSQISDHYHMHQKDKQMVFRSFIFFWVSYRIQAFWKSFRVMCFLSTYVETFTYIEPLPFHFWLCFLHLPFTISQECKCESEVQTFPQGDWDMFCGDSKWEFNLLVSQKPPGIINSPI